MVPYFRRGYFPLSVKKTCFHLPCVCISKSAMGPAENVLSLVTVTNVILGLVVYVALRFGCQVIYYRFFSPLAKFPGPFWSSVTRLWIAWHNLQETEVPTVYALAKKYGWS